MRFLYRQQQAKKKEIFQVDIDRSTKVKFMTASEFKRYKNARTHSFFGGTFDAGRVDFVVPFDSVWYVVVEKGTLQAPLPLTCSVQLAPPDREQLSSIALDAPAGVKALYSAPAAMEAAEDEVTEG